MSLAATPTTTYNAQGNILAAGTSIAGNGSNSASIVDFSNTLGGEVGVTVTGGGTVAATSGLRVEVHPALDSTPNYSTVARPQIDLTTVVSTTTSYSVRLPNGKFRVKLTNLDATNAVTVSVTSNPTS